VSVFVTFVSVHVLFTGEEGEETEVESPKIYEPIGSFKELSDRLEMHQQQYNESIRGAKMDLVFFKVNIYIFMPRAQHSLQFIYACTIYFGLYFHRSMNSSSFYLHVCIMVK